MESTNLSLQIQSYINQVTDRMQNAAVKAGRKLDEIKLVAVSKAQPVGKIKAAIESGITIFGENYPQESEPKILEINRECKNIEWHMIGHLQSRKAGIVCRYFSLFHSLDSVHLAQKLNDLVSISEKNLPVLLEVNISGEMTKSGWMGADIQKWETLLPDFEQILSFDHLAVKGLMAIPPLGEDKEESRPYFIKLRQLQEFLRKNLPNLLWYELSMGTSFDFEVAIEEGATLIRVGEAIFGKRIPRSDRQ
jgi:pyridoxal phosphate enzyme (YggS family)